jgi:hypothetical protein
MQIPGLLSPAKSKKIRSIKSSAEIKQHVENFKKSNLSMTDFCKFNYLPISTFSKWFNNQNASIKKFKPIALISKPATDASLHNEQITLEFNQSIKLTFYNMKAPDMLIQIVKGLATCN